MRARALYIFLGLFVLLIGGAAAVYHLYLPSLLKARVDRGLDRIAARFGVTVSVGEVGLELSGRVRLADLNLSHDGEPLARIQDVEVELKPLSFLYGRGLIDLIRVNQIRLHGGVDHVTLARGAAAPRGATDAAATSTEGGAPPPRRRSARAPQVDRIEFNGLSGAVTLAGNSFELTEGALSASLASFLVDEPEYLLEGRIPLPPDNVLEVKVQVGRARAQGSVAFARQLSFELAGRRVQFKAVHLDLPGRLGLEEVEVPPHLKIARVTIPTSGRSLSPRALVKEAFAAPITVTSPEILVDEALAGLLLEHGGASMIGRLTGMLGGGAATTEEGAAPDTSASEAPVEGSSPAPEEAAAIAPAAPDALPALPPEVEVDKDCVDFHSWFRGLTLKNLARSERLLRRASDLVERVPIRDLTVTGGTLRFSEGLKQAFPVLSDLSKIEARVHRGGDGRLEASLEYETSAARLVKDRLSVSSGPEGLSLGVRVDRLPAYPLQPALPKSVTVDPESRVRGLGLTLDYDPRARTADASLKLSADHVHVFDDRVSTMDLRDLDLRADVAARLSFDPPAVQVTRGELESRGIPLRLTGGATELMTCPKVSFDLFLPTIRAQDLIDRVPAGLIPLLKEVVIKGELQFQFKGGFDACHIDSLAYEMIPVTRGIQVESMGSHVDFEAVLGTFEKEIQEDEDTTIVREFGPGTPTWTPLELITPDLIKVVTTTEDGSFFEHMGFNTYQIRKAFVLNLKKLGYHKGASTVSMQLVKNVFLTRDKTLARKIQELFITWQMEETLTKEQILELYLNIVELGPDIYGVKEAALHFFCKRPRDLDLLESLYLATLLPSPKKYYKKFFEKGKITRGWQRYLEALLKIMVRRETISKEKMEFYAPYDVRFHAGPCELELEIDPIPGPHGDWISPDTLDGWIED
jgi:hypothetical protein